MVPPALQSIVKYDGHYVAAHFNMLSSNWVWVNKALFDQVGGPEPKTFDDFMALAEKFKEAGVTPVAHGGQIFGLTHRNKGQFFAVDARTGKTLWTTRGREAENAALAVAGNLVLATTTEAELIVFRADPAKFVLVKRYTSAESPVWAHPAPAGRGVLIKDAETLAYWLF